MMGVERRWCLLSAIRPIQDPIRPGEVGSIAVVHPHHPGTPAPPIMTTTDLDVADHHAAGALADELPYWGWLPDDRTCLTRRGELVTLARLSPTVVDGHTPEQLDAALQPRGMPQLLSTLRLSGHHTVMKSALVVYILRRLYLLKLPQDAPRFPLKTWLFVRTKAADAPCSPTPEVRTLSEMDAVCRGPANRAHCEYAIHKARINLNDRQSIHDPDIDPDHLRVGPAH